MSKAVWWVIVISGAALIFFIVYSAIVREAPPVAPPPAPVAAGEPPAPAPAEPQIKYPIQRPPEAKPLPALETSDATMRNALVELLSDKALVDLLQLNEFVRRIVVTVDNLPRTKIAQRLMPLKPAAGSFAVTGKDENLAIDPANAARYTLYLRLAATLDAEKTVSLYVHFYPLFQQAYRELGYPKGNFNDRLIEAIDNVLTAPDIKGRIRLTRPNVMYLYADPQLESLSAGQKAIIRVGSENEAQIKTKLREIRSAILRQSGSDAQGPRQKS